MSDSALRVSTVEKESLFLLLAYSQEMDGALEFWIPVPAISADIREQSSKREINAALNHPYNYFFLSKKFLITFISSPLIFLYRMHKRMVEN